jgi:signal transduction histidine kinase
MYFMRKIFYLILLVFTIGHAHAQNVNFDSLKRILAKKASDDTSRFTIIGQLSDAYEEYKPDSSTYYKKLVIDWAKKHNNAELLAEWNGALAYDIYIRGDYAASLDIALGSMLHFQSHSGSNGVWLANIYNLLGNIYKGQQNYAKAIPYYKRSLQTAAISRDTADMSYATSNLAWVYEKRNILDSAQYYVSKSEVYCRADHGFYMEYVLNIWGDIYLKLKDYKKAISYLQRSYALGVKVKNRRNAALTALSLVKYYKQVNEPDSAVYWAKVALTSAGGVREKIDIYESADQLWNLYEAKHQTDSAFKYLKLSSITKDSLYSTARLQAFDAINAAEDRRNEELAGAKAAYQNNLKFYLLLFVIAIVLVAALLLWRNSRNRQKALNLVRTQKEQTDIQKNAAEQALYQLKATQTQLIQSEKMASLGELTAGIAHEIQNPLNFVNNFSEVSIELLEELKEEAQAGHTTDVIAIADDLTQNLEKINHHGKRADFIVKGMLQHSRTGTGEKQPTNINILADEFLKLSYHGLRAKDKNFNAELVTNFDENLPKVNIAQQDIGRLLLNLFNNAFYAVNQKQKTAGADYKPEVTVSTSTDANHLIISVKDNGNGIPDAIKDKIMQPFFTTKPTGEGTGLGLSLSYDIVVKGHSGKITVNTQEGEYTEFTVILPIS